MAWISRYQAATSRSGPTTAVTTPRSICSAPMPEVCSRFKRRPRIAASTSAAIPSRAYGRSVRESLSDVRRLLPMRLMKKYVAALAALSLVACKLDLTNPNSPTEGQVTSSADATIGLATGLQGRFSQSYGNFAYMAGLVTDEFASTSAALISISDAEQGSVAPGAGIAENVFNSVYRTVRTSNELLAGSDALAAQFDAGTRSGLRALAFALKAESLGEALQSYQKIPIKTFGEIAPVYVARSEALPYIRALLDSAAAEIAATPLSALFNNSIMT